MTVAVRVAGEVAGPGQFAVPSATTPGEAWTVEYRCPGVVWCACPSFQRRQVCRHAEAVALAVEVEAREEVARSTPASRSEAAARLSRIASEFDCE